MNRAERRRQSAQQASRISRGERADPVEFQQALKLLRYGQLDQARELFERLVALNPRHADCLHYLGVITYRQGRLQAAKEWIVRALDVDTRKPHYHFNLGLVNYGLGLKDEAVAAYQHAVALKPDYAEALGNLGNMFRERGDFAQATDFCKRAVKSRPDHAGNYNNLGVVHKEQGQFDEAKEAYRMALRLNPQYPEALWNLGVVLQEEGHLDEAIDCFQSAIHVKPAYVKAHHSLGLALLWKGEMDLAFRSFQRAADLTHNHGQLRTITAVQPSRIKHDAEQMQYLISKGLLPATDVEYVQALQRLLNRSREELAGTPLLLTAEECRALAPSFNRLLHITEAPALPEGALNPALNVREIEQHYLERRPEILHVDSLLTETALRSLRRFCRESTIWKKDYDNGYIGAFLGEGFACPLLLQIAEELRLRFPGIFGAHRLVQAWAFKQDSQRKGLNIHADAAAVNVNFWITENEANLDPACGGLVVWDKEAPREWNFKQYNSVEFKPKIFEFLRQSGARAVTIPYRENRAVIFNSDLFHETDRCAFKDDYESRRINVTMLYGYRRSTYAHS